MKNKILETQRVYAIEDTEKKTIHVHEKSKRNFDGVIDDYVNETIINYDNGLYQRTDSTGYHANYYDCYIGRDNALKYINKIL